jgi:hypothetical protein
MWFDDHVFDDETMYVVESADDLAILSSIEIIWSLGKNCWVVGTRHRRFSSTTSQSTCGQEDNVVESADA